MADGDLFVPAALSPKNAGNFPVARNTDVLGAHQFVASIANLTDGTIRSGIRCQGQLATCLDTGIVYELAADLTTWAAKPFGTSWANITDKPSTFAPSAHNQAWSTITDTPSTFAPTAHAAAHVSGTDQLSDASDTVHGLMTAAEHVKLTGLHKQIFSANSIDEMLLVTGAQKGDLCNVDDGSGVLQFVAVTKLAYGYGANCFAGIDIDWLYEINVVYGDVLLAAGYAFVYIQGLSSESKVKVSYQQFLGETGTLRGAAVTDGIEIWSSNSGAYGTDNSLVTYEIAVV